MVLKLGRSGKQIRNAWKILKYGAGEGWRRSVGPIMWEMKTCYLESRKRKAIWIGHILRRKCLLRQVIEEKIKGQIEVTRRQGRRRKKLLDDRRGYCQLKEEAVYRTMWRNLFGRGFGPVVWQITDGDDESFKAKLGWILKRWFQIFIHNLKNSFLFHLSFCGWNCGVK